MFSVATRLPSIRNSTFATPTSSLALACRSNERVKRAAAVGEVIATFGAALAGGAGVGVGDGDGLGVGDEVGDGDGLGVGDGVGDGDGAGAGAEPPSGPAAEVPTRARSKYSVSGFFCEVPPCATSP